MRMARRRLIIKQRDDAGQDVPDQYLHALGGRRLRGMGRGVVLAYLIPLICDTAPLVSEGQ